jgi:hypothetical protein
MAACYILMYTYDRFPNSPVGGECYDSELSAYVIPACPSGAAAATAGPGRASRPATRGVPTDNLVAGFLRACLRVERASLDRRLRCNCVICGGNIDRGGADRSSQKGGRDLRMNMREWVQAGFCFCSRQFFSPARLARASPVVHQKSTTMYYGRYVGTWRPSIGHTGQPKGAESEHGGTCP